MSVTLVSTPTKTINGIESNVIAARSQALFSFTTDEIGQDNLKLNIEILDENSVKLIDVIFKYSFRLDGSITINLGRIVTEITESRHQLSTRFKVKYWETYTGQGPGPPPPIIGEWLAVYAEKQLLSIGGANMAEYVLDGSASKLATVFKNPVYWDGFERTVSMVIDSEFNTRTGLSQYRLKNRILDINKNEEDILYKAFITDLTPRLDLDHIINGGNYVGVSVDGLSEEILYERRDSCANPLMIDWLNSKGGIDQWLFNIDQIFERDSGQGLTYQSYITDDIATVGRTKFRQSPRWIQQVILKAENLTLDQLKALQEINSSISIRVWLNNDGSEWVGVIVSGRFSSTHNTQDALNEFSLQLEFPDNFDFEEGQNYFSQEIDILIDSDGEELIDSDLELLEG